MTNSKKTSSSSSGCFTSVLQRIVCGNNLPPVHPSPDEKILEKNEISNILANPMNHKRETISQSKRLGCLMSKSGRDAIVVDRSQVRVQVQASSPGVVAKLMGLDSLPNYENALKSTQTDALFRSKSVNSLHFLPDFDPARAAFHRRARSSASFREQGHSYLVKVDENVESNGMKLKEPKIGHGVLEQRKEKNRESATILKENECVRSRKNVRNNEKRYQERYYASTSTKSSRLRKISGVGDHIKEKCRLERRKLVNCKEKNVKVGSTVSRKSKVDQRQHMNDEGLQSDVSSRSPISVLDHHFEFDLPSKEDARRLTSNSRRMLSRKIESLDDMPPQEPNSKSDKKDDGSNKNASKHKLMKEEAEAAEYFVEMLQQVCTLAENQVTEDSKRITRKYEVFKAHYVEELCSQFGEKMLDLLLDELVEDLYN